MDDLEIETVISDDDIAVLNKARGILKKLEEKCSRRSWDALTHPSMNTPTGADYGRVHALSSAAEDSIFRVLNWANSHHVRPLTDEQLHNLIDDAEVAAPEAVSA